MEPVPSLKGASLCKLAEEIWRNWNVSSLLTNYAYEECKRKCDKAATADAQKAYHALLEKVINNIMTDNTILGPYRVDAAMAFIELELNMFPWAKKIYSHLRRKTKANIEYCLEKTSLTQNGKINGPRTLTKIMFDSFARIQFEGDSVSLACWVPVKDYSNFIWSEKYNKHQYRKLREKVESQMIGMNSEKTWETFPLSCHRGNASEAQIMLELVTVASPDLWLHLMVTRGRLSSQKCFCLTLVDTLLKNEGTKQEKSNIIMTIHQHLDKELWQKILMKYFQEMISPLFMSSYREYSLKLFNQVCYEIEEKACADTLKHLLDQMTNISQRYRCESVYFLKCKQIFLNMWNNTPLNAKTILGKDLLKILRELLKKTDFHFMSLLINDDAFNHNQKKDFIMTIILDLVSESELSKVDQFLQELPGHYNFDAKTLARDTIKKYIAAKRFALDYNAIFEFTFETKRQADAFRIDMLNDKDFVTAALTSLALGGSHDDLEGFLKWGFNNDECAINKFVDEKLKTEHWLVEIYKNYLSNVGRDLKYPKPFLLRCFLPEPEARLKFKRCVREDNEFLLAALDKMMVEDLSSLTSFLRCIFDETEKKERVNLVTDYLQSERGLSCIYDMIIGSTTSAAGFDINNGALHHRHKFCPLVQRYFKFRRHWFVCNTQYRHLLRVMDPENFNDLRQRMQEYKKNKREILLPHENLESFESIVKKNYETFWVIIEDYNLVEEEFLLQFQNSLFV